jgi:tRNA pseudouridine38-40 synthase
MPTKRLINIFSQLGQFMTQVNGAVPGMLAVSLNRLPWMKCCSMLRGTHNFEAFRGAPRGKGDRQKQMHQNTLCTLFDVSLEIETTSFPFPDLTTYRVSVTGDRFLYKMVRFLVGSLVAVGMGTLYPMEIDRALRTGSFDPGRKPQCAPGCGLVLVDVSYTPELEWQ